MNNSELVRIFRLIALLGDATPDSGLLSVYKKLSAFFELSQYVRKKPTIHRLIRYDYFCDAKGKVIFSINTEKGILYLSPTKFKSVTSYIKEDDLSSTICAFLEATEFKYVITKVVSDYGNRVEHIQKILTDMTETYQFFGSENSLDYDIIVFVDDISKNIDVAHGKCKEYAAKLSKVFTDKPINTNLAVLKDGFIVDVFKGTADEVNNSLFYTYWLHKQPYDLQIKAAVTRDKHEKIMRVARGILSFYSRSEHRKDIKPALKSDLTVRRKVLEKIDLSIYYDFKGKKESYLSILKVLAFQYAQLFSLIDGFEQMSYTKNGVCKNYPDLASFINREGGDLAILEKYKKRLLETIDENIPYMKRLYEIKQD